MKIKLKSNGKEMEVAKADFDKWSKDMKRNYDIIDKNDVVAEATTSNTVTKAEGKTNAKDNSKNNAPETGESK